MTSEESRRRTPGRQRRVIAAGVIAAGLAVLFIVVVAVLAYSHSKYHRATAENAGPWSTASGSLLRSLSSIAKPSPINQDHTVHIAPAPQEPTQIAAAAPAAPFLRTKPMAVFPLAATPTGASTAPAARPTASPAPAAPRATKMFASRDGFNNGCKHGELVIGVSTVAFTCPSDSSKNITVRAEQVKGLDRNGIVVFPGQKYHFDIAGKQKQDVHELFARWLENARKTTPERASN